DRGARVVGGERGRSRERFARRRLVALRASGGCEAEQRDGEGRARSERARSKARARRTFRVLHDFPSLSSLPLFSLAIARSISPIDCSAFRILSFFSLATR